MKSMRQEVEARKGYFGTFGGSYVPEQLQPRLDELEAALSSAMGDDLFAMKCTIYMGAVDVQRQAPNVLRMKALGAEVVSVKHGQQTLKEAVDAALEAYVMNPETFYLLGSAVGPHPFPTMVRGFQSVIGREAREQFLAREGRLPDHVVACVGGGSNAIGIFSAFLNDPGGGDSGSGAGRKGPGDEGSRGHPSISAGLDYPGVGPEHAHLMESGRASYVSVTDDEAVDAFKVLCRSEVIIPALESSHAVAHALKMLPKLSKDETLLVNLSGRGDKDLDSVLPLLGLG